MKTNDITKNEKPSPTQDGGGSILQRLVLSYLRKKYGGDVRSLKPPLGGYYYKPWDERLAYYKLFWAWKIDCLLFAVFGKPMRDAWDTWNDNYYK